MKGVDLLTTFNVKRLVVNVNPMQKFQYPTPAKRPMFSVLNISKIKEAFRVEVPYWNQALKVCLKECYSMSKK